MPPNDNSPKTSWSELVGIVVLVCAVLLLLRSWETKDPSPSLPGMRLPALMAEGWLNTDGPVTQDTLSGKVVLIDCWFTSCPPCRATMPELARLYKKYRSLGVEFIGLTYESGSQVPQVSDFVSSIQGFDWPVGYGATPTLHMLGVEIFPTIIVFGDDGLSRWSGISTVGLAKALDEALAARP